MRLHPYPVAPPRLLGQGYVDTVFQQSEAYRVLQPPAFVNQYAAMPSLHVPGTWSWASRWSPPPARSCCAPWAG